MPPISSSLPKISVVVPSLNQGHFIEETITSVLGQNYPNLELLVIDGGSTDHTIDILRRYEASLHYWVTERDSGQAEAINKGFRRATGDILCWLNSDDVFLPCALTKAVNAFTSISEPQLVYGGCLRFTVGTPNTHGILPAPFDAERLTYDDYLEQPSTFWTRRLWEIVGGLNEELVYTLDWDWFIRASKVCQFIPCNEFLSLFRFYDTHKTSSKSVERQQEIVHIVNTYASEAWAAAYNDVYRQIIPLRKWLRRLEKWHLHRLRYLFYPQLYLKHGRFRIDTALSWGH